VSYKPSGNKAVRTYRSVTYTSSILQLNGTKSTYKKDYNRIQKEWADIKVKEITKFYQQFYKAVPALKKDGNREACP